MSKAEKSTNNKMYFKVVEGSFRRAVPAGTPDAIEREWTAGGKSGVSIELEFKHLFGFITGVEFYEGEYEGKKFTNLQITLDDDEETGKTPIISVGAGTKYAFDFYHKLPNVDFEKDVRIRPFSFTPEGEDRAVIGVEIMQRDSMDKFTKSIPSFFFKKEGDKSVPVNGFPTRDVPFDEQTEEEREIYKIKRKGFLINHTKTVVIPKLTAGERSVSPIPKSYEEQELNKEFKKTSHTIDINEPIDESDPNHIPF